MNDDPQIDSAYQRGYQDGYRSGLWVAYQTAIDLLVGVRRAAGTVARLNFLRNAAREATPAPMPPPPDVPQ